MLLNYFRKNNTGKQKTLEPQNIVFNDVNLQVTIGQWLGQLSNTKVSNSIGVKVYTHLNAEELRKRTQIPKEKFNEINKTFRKLLTIAGIDGNEICVLDDYDEKKFSFNCHLEKANKDAKISLRWGDFLNFLPEFIIEYDNKKKVYEYIKSCDDDSYKFELQTYTTTITENGNTYYRFYCAYFAPITVENENYKLELYVHNDEKIDLDFINNYTFKLNNEEKIKEYLLGLKFPAKIDEVYKTIYDISLNSIKKYPKFSIKVTKKIDENNSKITDEIVLNHGKLENFIITRNGKTISIDKNNCWQYESDKMYANENEKGNMNFGTKEMSKEEISNLNINEQIKLINNDIEKVKKLSKTF